MDRIKDRLVRCPTDIGALEDLFDYYYQEKDFGAALKVVKFLQSLVKGGYASDMYLYLEGCMLGEMGDHSTAQAILEKLYDNDEKNPEVTRALGKLYMSMGIKDNINEKYIYKAIDMFEEAYKANVPDPIYILDLARARAMYEDTAPLEDLISEWKIKKSQMECTEQEKRMAEYELRTILKEAKSKRGLSST